MDTFSGVGWWCRIRIDYKAKTQFNCYCNCLFELSLAIMAVQLLVLVTCCTLDHNYSWLLFIGLHKISRTHFYGFVPIFRNEHKSLFNIYLTRDVIALHVKLHYMLNCTTCYIALHVTLHYLLNSITWNIALNVTWHYMLRCITCNMKIFVEPWGTKIWFTEPKSTFLDSGMVQLCCYLFLLLFWFFYKLVLKNILCFLFNNL